MDDFKDLISTTYTKDDLDTLYYEIDELLEGLYESGEESFDRVLEDVVRVKIADQLKNLLQETKMSKSDILKKLRGELDNIELLRLSLAYEPSRKSVRNISRWVKANISNYVVIDTHYSKQVMAGCVVEYKGNYIDYSLKNEFKSLVQSKKEQINEILSV
jgi:F0F1-type ATP synthase delta subunit